MITTTSVMAVRRLSGELHTELRVEVRGEYPPTAWPILEADSEAPYCIVDGHRRDLSAHEIECLGKAVAELLEEEKREADSGPGKLRRRNFPGKRN